MISSDDCPERVSKLLHRKVKLRQNPAFSLSWGHQIGIPRRPSRLQLTEYNMGEERDAERDDSGHLHKVHLKYVTAHWSSYTGKNHPKKSYPRPGENYSKGLDETMTEISQCRE